MAAAQTVFIQPAYVDALARYGRLGAERAGYILSWEMTAFAITTIAITNPVLMPVSFLVCRYVE